MPTEALRFRDLRRTSTFRLTVLLGLIFTLGTVALLSLIYVMTAHELTARSDHILRLEGDRLLATPPERLTAKIGAEVARNINGLNYITLLSRDDEPVIGNIRLQGPLPYAHPVDIEDNGRRGPMRLIALRTSAGETLLIGRDISQIRDLRYHILMIITASGLAITISILMAATALSLQPLRRVRHLQRVSREIASGHLDRRMPIAGREDELDQFASTVNLMVEEVGRVVAQVKGVTDAVAHDLRTPLMRVRTHLLRTQQLPDIPSDFAALAGKAVTDLDVVLDRFTALLRIAEIEASERHAGFISLDVAQLLADIHELYEPLAEEKSVTLTLDAASSVRVDADGELLFEAISNLVDNAIKFGHRRVSMSLTHKDTEAHLEITDDGPGVPAAEREAVLRRFHRGANAAGLPGAGLARLIHRGL
ncbi:HAMP domain-containing histidine kinase [soil metagenome]